MCPGWWGTESTLYTRQKWSTTGWAQETFKTDQSMEATSTTAKKKTMIKPSPSLSHTHKRWQALLPLGMLAACKETRNPVSKMSQRSCEHTASSVFLHMPAFLTAVTGATGAWKTSYGRKSSLPTKVIPFLSTLLEYLLEGEVPSILHWLEDTMRSTV